MDQAQAPVPDKTGHSESYILWRRIFFTVVLVVGLVAKLCGSIGWSHLIFAIISVPLTFPLICWALCFALKAGIWCCQPGPRRVILYYLSFCALLELYRVETQSETLTAVATGTRALYRLLTGIPLAILGIVSQEEVMGGYARPVDYSFSIWNVLNLAWGIPFFIAYFCLQAVIGIFYYKGKPTLVSKVAVGAAVGTAAVHVTRKLLNGKSKEA